MTYHFGKSFLLAAERKGRESVRVKGRKKRGREDSDPNGIGLIPKLTGQTTINSDLNILCDFSAQKNVKNSAVPLN